MWRIRDIPHSTRRELSGKAEKWGKSALHTHVDTPPHWESTYYVKLSEWIMSERRRGARNPWAQLGGRSHMMSANFWDFFSKSVHSKTSTWYIANSHQDEKFPPLWASSKVDESPFQLFALWGNKNWPPSMNLKKLKIFLNKMGSTGCKWSSLNAPGTENPWSHPILRLEEFPFPIIGPLG